MIWQVGRITFAEADVTRACKSAFPLARFLTRCYASRCVASRRLVKIQPIQTHCTTSFGAEIERCWIFAFGHAANAICGEFPSFNCDNWSHKMQKPPQIVHQTCGSRGIYHRPSQAPSRDYCKHITVTFSV